MRCIWTSSLRSPRARCSGATFSTESASVGFVGLGKIGYAMARNMIGAGESLVVYDTDPCAVARIVDNGGAVEAASAAEVAASTSRLVTVLPNDAILEQVVAEISPVLAPRSVHVGCSTISPYTARAVAATHAEQGSSYISAPVFARPDGMASAQATIPVSGPATGIARILPLLEATSSGVFQFGEDPGSANVVKLGGNFLIAAAIEAMAESLALAEANGVDQVKMMQMLNATIFDCLIYKGYGQRVSERDHKPYEDAHFSLELGLKDINLVSATATASATPMPLCSLLKDRYMSASNLGWGDMDWSSIGMKVALDAGLDIDDAVQRSKKL